MEELRYSHERLPVRVGLQWQKGGIFLLQSMLDEVLAPGSATLRHCDDPKREKLSQFMTSFNHSYAVMGKYEARDDGQSQGGAKKVTRVERYLGFRQGVRPATRKLETPPNHDIHAPQVIVIDDANLGFRDGFKTQEDLATVIPQSSSDPNPWVLLKMSDQPARGDLWKQIAIRLKNPGDWLRSHLIVQTSAARLREEHGEISRDLSWERSANDVWAEIKSCSSLKDLSLCRFLVVSFGPTGALFIEHDEDPQLTLIYDADSMEGDWADKHKRHGMMFGYGSCLCTCLVANLVNNYPSSDHLIEGVKSGLTSMQRLYEEGFRDLIDDEFGVPGRVFNIVDRVDLTAEQREELHRRYGEVRNRFRRSKIPVWGGFAKRLYLPILQEPACDLDDPDSKLLHVAKQGVKALGDETPIGRFGDLVTVDKGEIESLRAIRNLISSYCDKVELDAKPLAVAVFGGPGSGKSYAIKQLVSPWRQSGRIEPIEPFNLSQFSVPSDLVGALHQIRDVGLKGPVPLAFWDEFDTPLQAGELGWLRYFLAPMQDGQFQQGDQVHLIGPSVFVFAGGTFRSFASFNNKANNADPAMKAADFVSRLQGYIDIPDVNMPGEKSLEYRRRARMTQFHAEQPTGHLMLRRAMVLNSLFKKNKVAQHGDGSFIVDDGIVHAFLGVRKYEHGVRSMEAVIKMSRFGSGEPFDRSSLPTEEQLNVHVDGEDFLNLMRQHQVHDI
ncbi:hypothetical protein AB0B01_01790 [Streptomyces sp. NPDC044571]|uniref:hypothetical protein n=1 Tax=Streptomyces sp. NPDC044571 TaxID=3155371 RepID=UPI0033EA0DDD